MPKLAKTLSSIYTQVESWFISSGTLRLLRVFGDDFGVLKCKSICFKIIEWVAMFSPF